jgi:hypothetical protein
MHSYPQRPAKCQRDDPAANRLRLSAVLDDNLNLTLIRKLSSIFEAHVEL